jgi:hypothetical protein
MQSATKQSATTDIMIVNIRWFIHWPFRELPFGVGTMGGVTIKRNEFNSRQPPIGHTSLVQTDTMPAFLAESDVLFFHPDEGSVRCE